MDFTFDTPHAAEFGGGSILDEAALVALQELGGDDEPDLVAELVALFLDDASERMAQIESALPGSDCDAIGSAAHALKSASANMGAHAFSATCAELEAAARSDDAAFEALARRALGMFDEVKLALQSLNS